MKKVFKSKTFILTFALLLLLQNVQAFAGTNTISYSASTTSIKVNQASTLLAISSSKVAVKSFSINKAALSVPIGYKETLRTTMLPSNATNKK